jgi:indole-3-acetate monooxygenase
MATTNLVQQLEQMLPAIRSRREQIERERRLPPDLVKSLRDTRLFALEVPRALGGSEAAPAEILRAIETVSRADGSTGWCAAVAISNNGIAGVMRESGAREVFADPTAPSAGVFAPSGTAVRVDGGLRVSGRWHFASGINHSDWLWAGCVVTEDGQPRMTSAGPEIVYALMPTSALAIHDTWFVSGLCGTGSHDVSARDLFVPEQRTFALDDPATTRPEPLYQLPILSWFVAHAAAVSLGLARGALDELVEAAQNKVPTFSAAALADRPAAQLELARAEAALGAARAFLYEAVDDLWQAATAGKQPEPRQIASSRVAGANAVEVGAKVTRTASVLAGGSSIFSQSSMQRHMRDADAVAHHFSVSAHVWEDAGRVFMGRTPSAPMF